MTITQVHRVEYRRDGVLYTIYVEACDGMMRGTWTCRECGSGGSNGNETRTIGDAVLEAQDNIDLHHEAFHPSVK
jgi:hypothetical protein